jgi:hypothetical protein
MTGDEHPRYADGKDCPALPELWALVVRPARLDVKRKAELDAHLDICDFCAHQLEIADRRARRRLLSGIARQRGAARAKESLSHARRHTVPAQPQASPVSSPTAALPLEALGPLLRDHILPQFKTLLEECVSSRTRAEVPPGDGPVPGVLPRVSSRRPDWVRTLVSLAAVLLLVLLTGATVIASVAAIHNAREAQQQKDEVSRLEGVLTELRQQPKIVEPIPPDPAQSFRTDFLAAQEITAQLDDKNPFRLVIPLHENTRLPYYTALRVVWDAKPGLLQEAEREESDRVYYWRSRPLPQFVDHVYERDPKDPPRYVTVKFLFFPTKQAQSELGVPDPIVKTVALLLSSEGLVTLPSPDAHRVSVKIVEPATGEVVKEQFRLSLVIEPPGGGPARAGETTASMLHVLIRPLDGGALWKDRYYLLPDRLRVSDLARPEGGKRPYSTLVSLYGLLGNPSPVESYPTRFQILVVELPFRLRGWEIPKKVLELLRDPAAKGLVKAEWEVRLKGGPGDLASRTTDGH